MEFWRPGTEVMWRYGEVGNDFASPARVVRDDERALVAWVPMGTRVLKLVREDGRDLRADRSDQFSAPLRQVESVWADYSVLRVYLPGRWWSVWVFFHGETGVFEGWYVNIEDPHVRTGRTTRSRDHVLDVWVEPDRTVERKDEDELVLAVEQGRYTQAEADAITAVADEVEEVVRAWGPPFCDGWESFTPDPDWPEPTLVRTHPLWNPYDPPSQEEIDAARAELGVWTPTRVEVVAPDPAWPAAYDVVRERVVAALGRRVLALEHVGSTSVPGLWAKPMIDVDLTVADSGDEDSWLPDLEAAGFQLRVREPDWEEHRCLRGADPAANVHVWSPGAREPRRHQMFRDWLRAHPGDRDRYAEVKREVAARGFTDQMLYNNEKAWVVYDLYEKIFAADPDHEHDPHPR